MSLRNLFDKNAPKPKTIVTRAAYQQIAEEKGAAWAQRHLQITMQSEKVAP